MKQKFLNLYVVLFIAVLLYTCTSPVSTVQHATTTELRAPAYPLVTIDPYISAWARTDRLFDGPVKHWTGQIHPLIGAVRVDGQVYRFLGKEIGQSGQEEIFSQAAFQKSVALSATSTIYTFACGPVDLRLQFTSPLLPEDPDLLSRPVNYISYEIKANDGAKHDVQIYFEGTPEWAVNEVSQEVRVSKGQAGEIRYAKAGTTEQPVLQKKGDNVRIDWGYFYLAAPGPKQTVAVSGDYFTPKTAFAQAGKPEAGEDTLTAKMENLMPAMSIADALGEVSSQPAGGYILIGYDDIESVQYFGTNLKAWWTKNGAVTMDQALQDAAKNYEDVMQRCAEMDKRVWNEALAAGGKNYADLCVLAFRQSIAAHAQVGIILAACACWLSGRVSLPTSW
jgi:hypothetical protein